MDDLNWFGKMLLVGAVAVGYVLGQGIMSVADAGTISPHVNTCKVVVSDSTPLAFPYQTNVVINPTANWGLKAMTLKRASYLMLPHSYHGREVCVLDTRAGAGLLLQCEALLGHGRHQAFHAFADVLKLYPATK